MSKAKVLFICAHNSARSQMSEALLQKMGGDYFEVESAGFEPTAINPLVVRVMAEEGIDLSNKTTQSIYRLVKANRFYGYVVTVCNRSLEEECPYFPGMPKRIHWQDLENPESYDGSEDDKLAQVRDLKERIKTRVRDFIGTYAPQAEIK